MGWTSEWLSRTLQRRPAVLRALVRFSESIRPGGVIVGRASEVRDIFDRTHDFQVGITIAPKTKTGPFLLSMDEGPRHSQEKRALVAAINGPFENFARIAARESQLIAAEVATRASRGGTIDLASDYAERVFIRTLAEYFGLPIEGWRSAHLNVPPGDAPEGERTLALYIRYLGATIGSGSSPAPFGLEALAVAIAEDFTQQLTPKIAAQKANPQPGTVLGSLFAASELENDVGADARYVQEDGLTRSIAGLLSAGASFPKAVANVLYELAQRNLLGGLVEKATDPGVTPDAWKAFIEPYVLEALRFRPAFPVLARYCPRSVALAGREVAAGSAVVFSPLAAMFDPELVDRPEEFIPGRPADTYLIFGAGPRACIGKQMMLGLFPPLLRELFTQMPKIASAAPGTFRYDGAALEHYWVTLDRAEAEVVPLPPPRQSNPMPPRLPLTAVRVVIPSELLDRDSRPV